MKLQSSRHSRKVAVSLCLLTAWLAACASSRDEDRDAFLDGLEGNNPRGERFEDDPFDDPFFEDGPAAGDSLDDFLREPAPSVGWLSEDGSQNPEAELLRSHGDATWFEADDAFGGDSDEKGSGEIDDRPFGQQAQEAALATMSVLVGAGMAALPYLLAAF